MPSRACCSRPSGSLPAPRNAQWWPTLRSSSSRSQISPAAVAVSQSAASASVKGSASVWWAVPSWTTWTRPGCAEFFWAGLAIGASRCQVLALTRARITVANCSRAEEVRRRRETRPLYRTWIGPGVPRTGGFLERSDGRGLLRVSLLPEGLPVAGEVAQGVVGLVEDDHQAGHVGEAVVVEVGEVGAALELGGEANQGVAGNGVALDRDSVTSEYAGRMNAPERTVVAGILERLVGPAGGRCCRAVTVVRPSWSALAAGQPALPLDHVRSQIVRAAAVAVPRKT